MNGQTYVIPRNYIEGLSNNNNGTVGAISLRAVLPDFGGLTTDTIRCGVVYRDPYNSENGVIGLTSESLLTNNCE